jgi:hypothetical protein
MFSKEGRIMSSQKFRAISVNEALAEYNAAYATAQALIYTTVPLSPLFQAELQLDYSKRLAKEIDDNSWRP